ncbi:hypothetical protein [Myxococcus qinghaiensis]|uniref:hypothetical protein n=1 Tax=Myxococcus qinghaiensis TaxID=2906758 RepID=UPI0020A71FE2|nr:hypothetical protein [Myxococcus qinghaiensis]MCP3168826.1 hypothetical protein [Myxococcus qinghaiensis]
MRSLDILATPALVAALCTLLVSGCGGSPRPEGDAAPGDPQTGGLEGASGSEDGVPGLARLAVCHIPPGNPANAHTIVVGAPAVKAHLKHGDTLGACGGAQDAGPGGEPDAGPGGEPDAGPACVPTEGACGSSAECCEDLTCTSRGVCEPQIG